jgi:hypothetical protein
MLASLYGEGHGGIVWARSGDWGDRGRASSVSAGRDRGVHR